MTLNFQLPDAVFQLYEKLSKYKPAISDPTCPSLNTLSQWFVWPKSQLAVKSWRAQLPVFPFCYPFSYDFIMLVSLPCHCSYTHACTKSFIQQFSECLTWVVSLSAFSFQYPFHSEMPSFANLPINLSPIKKKKPTYKYLNLSPKEKKTKPHFNVASILLSYCFGPYVITYFKSLEHFIISSSQHGIIPVLVSNCVTVGEL